MSLDLRLQMFGSAPSLPEAVDVTIRRLVDMGLKLDSPLRTYDQGILEVEPYDPNWGEVVDRWPSVAFGIYQPGPSVGVHLYRHRGSTFRVGIDVTWGLLRDCFQEGPGEVERILYAPLFQIATALGVRAGVGSVEYETELDGDEDVLRELGLTPGSTGHESLGFLRRHPGVARPVAPYHVTERPEGYWLLESEYYRKSLADAD